MDEPSINLDRVELNRVLIAQKDENGVTHFWVQYLNDAGKKIGREEIDFEIASELIAQPKFDR